MGTTGLSAGAGAEGGGGSVDEEKERQGREADELASRVLRGAGRVDVGLPVGVRAVHLRRAGPGGSGWR